MVHKGHSKDWHVESGLTTIDKKIIAKNSLEAGKAVTGALVGLVIGGPPGAVVGAVTSPVITLTQDIINKAIERRRIRLEKIVNDAITISGLEIDNVLSSLSNDDNKTDDFLLLLSIASNSDKAMDSVFKGLISEILKSNTCQQKDRLLIIGDSVRNFRAIHLRILEVLYGSGGKLPANEIAIAVKIPEIELRSVVRDLELRGMIKDLERKPIEWELRELGRAVALFVQKNKEEE